MTTDLSKFLRDRKSVMGLSVEQIAAQLELRGQPTHPNAVQRWLTGATRPAPERYDALLEVLGVLSDEDRREAYRLRWPEAAAVLEDDVGGDA